MQVLGQKALAERIKKAQKNLGNTDFWGVENENSPLDTQNWRISPTLKFDKYCDLHFYICVLKNTQKTGLNFSRFRESFS